MTRRRRAAVVLAATLLALAVPREAVAGCESEIRVWAGESARCHLSPVVCPPGGAVVELSVDGDAPLRVEVRESEAGFRRARGLSLSPVLEVPEWSDVSPARRAAFERFVACVEEHPRPFPIVSTSSNAAASPTAAEVAPRRGPPRPPWRLVAGVVSMLAALALMRRRRPSFESALVWLGLPTLSLVLWRLAWARGFLHPNGQGPLWIHYALDPDVDRSPYGPGYAELYGWLCQRHVESPEDVVLNATSLLVATSSPAAFTIARRAGVPRFSCTVVAAAFVLSPTLGRFAQSQSYYASIAALSLLAALSVSLAPRVASSLRARASAVACFVAAGLLLAAALRVHPIGWVAVGCAPLVALAVRRRRRAWLGRVLLAIVCPLAVALVAGGAQASASFGEAVGRQWLADGVSALIARAWLPVALCFAALTAGVVLRSRVVVGVLAGAAIVSATGYRALIASDPELYQWGFGFLFAGALLGPLSLVLSARGWPRRIGLGALVVVWLAGVVVTARDARVLTTNAEEQAFLIDARNRLPAGATLSFVGRAGDGVLILPLYGAEGKPSTRVVSFRAEDEGPRTLPTGALYYRSSLCHTPEGRAACDAFDRRYLMTPIATTKLSPRPSKGAFRYEPGADGSIDVGLYRVETLAW